MAGANGNPADALRTKVVQLARGELAPSCEKRSADRSAPADLFQRLAQADLLGAWIPEALGGMGLDASGVFSAYAGLAEASADPGVALAAAMHGVVAVNVLAAIGTGTQQALLAKMARAEVVVGIAAGEFEGGANPDNQSCTLSDADNTLALQGRKVAVVNAPLSTHLLVLARHGEGYSACLMDSHAPGVRIEPSQAFPVSTCPTADVYFDKCIVAPGAIVGERGRAHSEVLPLMNAVERTLLLAPWIGAMEHVLQKTLVYTAETKLAELPLRAHQGIRRALFEMRRHIERSVATLELLHGRLQVGRALRVEDALSAKLLVGHSVAQVMSDAMALRGFVREPSFERLHREACIVEALGGGAVLQQTILASAMLGIG